MPSKRIPSRVYIDVTNQCQLRCLHCYASSGAKWDNELTLAEIKKTVDQVYEMGVKNVTFSGGEPLMRAELPEILEYACKKGLDTTLLTNGLLINEEWAKLFAQLNIRVKMSLDGATAETHDYLRGKGSFEKLKKAIFHLLQAQVDDIALHFTIHRKNVKEILLLPELLQQLGVRNLVVGTIKPSGRAEVNSELLLPPAMIPYVQQKVSLLSLSEYINIQQFSEKGWDGFGCPATCNKLGITASGDATVCVFLGPDFLGNNIRDYSLAELWEQHLAQEDFFVANDECARCPVVSDTGGGCRARALYYHHDINGTDPHCCALYEQTLFLEKYNLELKRELQLID